MKIVLDVRGRDKLIANFKKFAAEGEQVAKDVTEIKALEIAAEAKRKAPVDMGELQQNIYPLADRNGKGLKWKIVALAQYAAYIEFGTGGKVDPPEEWDNFAKTFQGKSTGTFDQGLKRIRAWLKRQGGDEDDAEFVFYLILTRGIEPQPFMYPAFLKGRATYKKDLENEYKRLIDKYNK